MRVSPRSLLVLLSCAATAVLGLVVLPLVVAPLATPVGATTAAGQIVTVQTTAAGSTTGRLDLWRRNADGSYSHAAGPFGAHVGELGIGTAHEGIARTPAGVYGLTQAFGNQPNWGGKLPYFQANQADWWDGESGTKAYNTHLHQAASPGPASENLYTAGEVYSHAVVIDYNRFPVVAGAGSAFFLHVTNRQPTAGCVAIAAHDLHTVMLWLDPTQHPVISIGVGSQATAPITSANAAAHNPMGYLDAVNISGRTAKVVGWAADPDGTSSQLQIEVYFNGVLRGRTTTGVARPDVAKAKHVGPNQGYSLDFATVTPGRRTICVNAVNIKLGTGNTQLGCLTVTVH